MLYGLIGDPLYNVWLFAKLTGQNLAVSFGFNNPDAFHILLPSQPLIDFQAKILTHFFGPIWAYNILIIIGFVLTFIASYLILKKFGKSRAVAFVCALLITFLPYRLIHSQFHISLSSTHWLLFSLYFLIEIYEKPNFKNMLGTSVFSTLTMLDNYQYGAFVVFCAVILVITAITRYCVTKKIESLGKFLLFSFLAVVLALALLTIFDHQLVASFIKGSALTDMGPKRKVEELGIYSARWFYYLTPSNLLSFFSSPFAGLYKNQIARFRTTPEEQVLFVGWLPLLLAGASLLIKKEKGQKFKYCFILLLCLSALLFSFSPTINIFGHSFEAPSKILYDSFPVVRVYARFGFLVGLCCILLASFTLNKIVKKYKYHKAALFAFGIITLFEFFPKNPLPLVNQNQTPAIYGELEKQESGPVAEYPFFASDEPRGYLYLFAQLSHRFPLLYGSTVDSEGDVFRRSVIDPTKENTITALKNLGTKYIIIHQDIYKNFDKTRYPGELNQGIVPEITDPRAELVKCIDRKCLYKII